MNILQKLKLRMAMKKAGDASLLAAKAICEIGVLTKGALKTLHEITEAENDLAAVSSYDLVHALRPVAQELYEWTGVRYVDRLDQAKKMILEGKEIPDVLYHFDMMLYDLKEGKR